MNGTASILALSSLLSVLAAQPLQPVRLCAEWEPSFGTLIRWPLGIPSQLVVELAEDDSLYVLYETPSQQSQAVATFTSWGVNLDHCRFIQADTYSHWTRDWGPHSMFDGEGVWGIIDPIFEGYPWIPGGPYGSYMRSRGYEEDDAVNAVLAGEFQCPLHQFPAYLTGGNFMSDGHGFGYSTLAMLTENEPLWTHAQFLQLSEEWLGLDAYFITVNPEDYGIQHIDCCAKLLDEETILLKQVDTYHPEYQRLETINDQLTTAMNCYGRPYEIVRIYCGPYSGSDVAAYTNSYILNTKVLVPMFGISSDSSAMQTYREAMPGYEVIGIPFDAWYYYDALHCRTREIMDRGMLLIWHRRMEDEVPWQDQFDIEVMIRAYSGEGLDPGETGVNWRVDSGSWNFEPLIPSGPDSLQGYIPGQPVGSVIDYFISAADPSGRSETLPRTAPEGFYSFAVTDPAGTSRPQCGDSFAPEVHPNPASGSITVSMFLEEAVPVTVMVFDATGRTMAASGTVTMDPGHSELLLDLEDVPAGCYLVRIEAGRYSVTRRFVRIR
ncbi:MAG: hypothetical protein AVO35_12945 [Candidatus Aegiribacteria sp. MLS_C]|nr:MAG: hypothetical protein AVO35_12945 [Candidatus Aegiribacteria sp. MLS_C]